MQKSMAIRIVFGTMALLSSSACGLNTVRIESAADVAAQGRSVASASQTFLQIVRTTREATNVDMVVADPMCGRDFVTLRRPPLVGPRAPVVGWLCTQAGPRDRLFSIDPLNEELKPTLDGIAALTAYADALTEIVDATPADPAKDLTDALELARAAQTGFTTVFRLPAGPLPAADDPRLVAATGFIRFLGELRAEARTVNSLRTFLATQPEQAAPTVFMVRLKRNLAIWETSRLADDQLRQQASSALVERVIHRRNPAAPRERREALSAYYEREAARRGSQTLFPALSRLVDTLDVADREMRGILRANPNLSDKHRRRVAEINRKRIIRALESVTALITAFRGA